ncbi:MAG: ABC transporter permease subunit [Xanthomonadales bacterium]|jgi:phosphate transport system permease protein|nr:ABC transporter permease subunit [Xanthomonadales bacterium]
MNAHPLSGVSLKPGDSDRLRARRQRRDRIAHRVIMLGGLSVVAAMLLILGYLLWVVLPLAGAPEAQAERLGVKPAWSEEAGETRLFAVDERGDLGLRLARDGSFRFFRLPGGEVVAEERLPLGPEETVRRARAADADPGRVAVATSAGRVFLVSYDFDRQPAAPGALPPVAVAFTVAYGGEGRFFSRRAIDDLDYDDAQDRLLIAVLAGGELVVEQAEKRTDFLTGEVRLESGLARRNLGFTPRGVVLDGNHRWVTVGDATGRLHRFVLPGLEPLDGLDLERGELTALQGLAGGVSLLVGWADGSISQVFPVRDDDPAGGTYTLQHIRDFDALDAPVTHLLPESRRRGFAAVSERGALGLYHSTAGRQVLETTLPGSATAALAFPPRADQLLQLDVTGELTRIRIDNPHPEVSFSTLWRAVWYENYPAPGYTWQSTAANDDFEPKFSLTPLALGTFKASLYAMLFAVPVALLGATYTAVFMAPALRRKVKPAIELMAALPTVILGFLAGLWLAPFIEENLAGLFSLMLLVPAGLLAFAYLWHASGLKQRFSGLRGWEPLLLIPVMIGLAVLALWLAGPLQQALVGGDLREWLSQEAGISYDQRNAIIVGIAMGFSIIPIIFSIAEDALYAVPTTLSDGSLALGATRWQSLIRIVLPTASPGIFSGLMIGLGRAVGETMIVLMATGNTPIMGWSAFEGMRTLAANIAIEMPESSVASTHFRVLFLSALVLFVFTFVVNTVAEVIRQRLRERYASL